MIMIVIQIHEIYVLPANTGLNSGSAPTKMNRPELIEQPNRLEHTHTPKVELFKTIVYHLLRY